MFSLVKGPEQPTVVVVYWTHVLAVLGAAWTVLMPMGRLMTDAGVDPAHGPILRTRRHPAVVLLLWLAAIPPLSFIVAIVISRLMWGHFFVEPAGGRLGWSQIWRLFMILLPAFIVPPLCVYLVVRRLRDRFRIPRGFAVEPLAQDGISGERA